MSRRPCARPGAGTGEAGTADATTGGADSGDQGRPLRLLLVSQEYPPQTGHGGIGTQTHAKAHGLAALGHEVRVLSHATGRCRQVYRDGPVEVIRVPGFDDRLDLATEAARCLTYSARVAAEIASLQTQRAIDLIDFPEWAGEAYVHLLNQVPWNRIPSVIQLHGPLVMLAHTLGWPATDSEHYRTGTQIESTCLRLADAVYASSRCSIDWCARHYGLDAATTPVIHTGVDTALFHPRPRPATDPPTLVFAGRVSPSKGVFDLVEAACLLRPRLAGLRLHLVGRCDPDLGRALRDLAAARGAPDLLHLVGHVPHDRLAEELGRGQVFAAPSRYEGGPGFVYLEAMACGLPVIACEGSGVTETVAAGVNGFLVPPGDVPAIADAVDRLFSQPELHRRMSAAARHYAVAEADSRNCLRRLARFYQDLLSGPVEPAPRNEPRHAVSA